MCGSKAINSKCHLFACSLMHLVRHAGKVSVPWGVSQNQASSLSPLRQKKNLVCALGWRSWVPAHDDAHLISGNGPTEQTDGHGQQDQQLECVFRISCPIIPPFKLRLEWVDAAEYKWLLHQKHTPPSPCYMRLRHDRLLPTLPSPSPPLPPLLIINWVMQVQLAKGHSPSFHHHHLSS